MVLQIDEKTSAPLLLVRIDSYDPAWRDHPDAEVDLCIFPDDVQFPESFHLAVQAGLNCGWSDCYEEILLIFDHHWKPWFAQVREKGAMAFSNADAPSVASIELGPKEKALVDRFLALSPIGDEPGA
jgi:hypothetical protein